MIPALAVLPWVGVVLFAVFGIRFPERLPPAKMRPGARGAEGAAPTDDERRTEAGAGGCGWEPEFSFPFVSVVVPARNEEATIETCLAHLTASRYPRFEVLVVDDRSEDVTRALAADFAPGNARTLGVVDGAPLPDGWMGKPWACWQGYQAARGDLLLFTDADSRHAPDLLERAVRGMEEDGADALTLLARQLMETFWEKVVQPQMFAMLTFRFPRTDRIVGPGSCRHALANGQFILVRRDVYEAVGGHERVKGEVVEDLRFAQDLCREGYRLSIRDAEDVFSTRMYRSLSHLVEGWTKNVATAARLTLPRAVAPAGVPLSVLVGWVLWLLPPRVLAVSLAEAWGGRGAGPGIRGPSADIGSWGVWSAAAVGLSVFFWCGVARRSRIPAGWGLLYPLGTLVTTFVALRSWARGGSLEWKGRRYRTDGEGGSRVIR